MEPKVNRGTWAKFPSICVQKNIRATSRDNIKQNTKDRQPVQEERLKYMTPFENRTRTAELDGRDCTNTIWRRTHLIHDCSKIFNAWYRLIINVDWVMDYPSWKCFLCYTNSESCYNYCLCNNRPPLHESVLFRCKIPGSTIMYNSELYYRISYLVDIILCTFKCRSIKHLMPFYSALNFGVESIQMK